MDSNKEAKKIFNKVLQRQIPEALKQSGSNLQVGIVVSFNTASRVAVIRMKSNNQVVGGVKVSNQINILRTNEEVVMLSIDHNFIGRNYVVASFGGNYRDTVTTSDST